MNHKRNITINKDNSESTVAKDSKVPIHDFPVSVFNKSINQNTDWPLWVIILDGNFWNFRSGSFL